MDELEMRMYVDLKLKEFTDGLLEDINKFFGQMKKDQDIMADDLDKRMTQVEEFLEVK